MTTLQAVLDLARKPLNDEKDASGSDAACRFPDSRLLLHAIHGLLNSWRNRQDLWVGLYNSPPTLALTAVSAFPLADEYIQPLADYVTARVQSSDDEAADAGRAALHYQLFGAVVSQ